MRSSVRPMCAALPDAAGRDGDQRIGFKSQSRAWCSEAMSGFPVRSIVAPIQVFALSLPSTPGYLRYEDHAAAARAGSLKSSSFVSMAQICRTILLVRAIATTILGLRDNILASHESSGIVRRRSSLTVTLRRRSANAGCHSGQLSTSVRGTLDAGRNIAEAQVQAKRPSSGHT